MNEQLQAKLVEILVSIQSATKAAGDFAMEQLPDIAQQYIVYGRVTATLFLVMAVAAFVASMYAFLVRGVFGKVVDRHGAWAESRVAATMIGGFFSLMTFGAAAITANSAALVWFAPKVWLLKEIAGLVR